MRIAVNTRLLLKNKLEGIGWFTYESFIRITQSHPEHDFLFIFDRPFDDAFVFSNNVEACVVPPPARHPILYRIWFDFAIPLKLRRWKADVFVSPDGYLSQRTKLPQLAVIHDLNFEHYPQDLPDSAAKYYLKYFPRFARIARRIATVSQYSKADISRCYDIAPEKIDVVYNGAKKSFGPLSQEEQQGVRAQYTGGNPYFIYVGSMHPRKNIPRLLKAFDDFSDSSELGIRLVLVGEKMWADPSMDEALAAMRHRDSVIFTGRLEDVALARVLASAKAMVYVPYFEGFGIPLLEAFAAGVPVITANCTSMPEVAGDAALLVDPFDVSAISEAMKTISLDGPLSVHLVQKGFRRLHEFSWDDTAQKLWACIEKTMEIEL